LAVSAKSQRADQSRHFASGRQKALSKAATLLVGFGLKREFHLRAATRGCRLSGNILSRGGTGFVAPRSRG
jgi:hypothetical protein